jgi:hypothetical protein
VPWLVLGLATLCAGCTAGGAPEKGDTGAGGHGAGKTTTEKGAGKAPECSVATTLDLGTSEATSPAVAFAGGRFAVAWTEQHTGLHLAVVDDQGNQAGARILATGAGAAEPAVTALPKGGFLVVWQETGAVRAIRVGTDAAPAGSAFTLDKAAGSDARPSAAAAGGTLIAWAAPSGVTVGELNETRLGTTATVAGAAGPALAPSADALVFTVGDQLGFARPALPLHGVNATIFRDLPGAIRGPRASAAGGGSFFVTWEDDAAGDGNEAVDLTLVGADGKLAKPSSEVPVPGEAGSANDPDVATVGGYAAVVYYQWRDGPPAVYLSLFGRDLRRAGEDLRLSEKGARFPRVAAGEGALGVVYARKEAPARLSLVTCH